MTGNLLILLEQIYVVVLPDNNGKADKIVIKITINHKQVLRIITLVINLLPTINLVKTSQIINKIITKIPVINPTILQETALTGNETDRIVQIKNRPNKSFYKKWPVLNKISLKLIKRVKEKKKLLLK
jgi:hypothetical protein